MITEVKEQYGEIETHQVIQDEAIEERNENESQEEHDDNNKDDEQPLMILAIDIGDNIIKHLKIFNDELPEKDIYEFCVTHKLDFDSLVEITKQVHQVIAENRKAQAFEAGINLPTQENVLTTVQTEHKTDTKRGSQVTNKKNDLLSYQESNNQQQYDIKELLHNDIVTTHDNHFYLVSNSKNQTHQNSSKRQNTITTEQRKNKGVELYQKGIDEKKKVNEKMETLRDALNKSDEEIYTFHPRVNEQSKESKAFRDENKIAYDNPDIILHYKLFNQNKQQILTDQNDAENKTVCSFKPDINLKSAKIDKCMFANKSFSSRFEKLYQDKEISKRNLKTLTKECNDKYSYHPKINRPIPNLQDKRTLNNSKIKEKRKIIIEENESKFLYDKETKQKLFKPRLISRPKSKNCLKKDENRFNKLYAYANIYQKKKDEYASIKNHEETKKTYTSSKNSLDLFNKKKNNCFKKLFQLLDSDEDDIISSNAYSTAKLSQELIDILKPIFIEFKEDYETLNEIEFIKVCEQLYKHGSIEQKKTMITFTDNYSKEKKNKPPAVFPFKPLIDKKSKNIMKRTYKEFDDDIQNLSRIGCESSISHNNVSHNA